jgi:hypothetical protein
MAKKKRGRPTPPAVPLDGAKTLADFRAGQALYGNGGMPTPFAFVYECPRCKTRRGQIMKDIEHCYPCKCRMKLVEG